ncbi:MAG: CoA transferase [Kyrpidia sp.]|nr:CoA transferase [Kyrpidia sp.]
MGRKPLEGIRVIDLTRVLAGPYTTMMLADLGAEVIKIEQPGTGDDSREFGPFKNGESGYYIFLNRGKQGMTLNLKEPRGRQILFDLVKISDVVIENFKPGVTRKLGIDYEQLCAHNPKLIMCSISGFGQSGPLSDRPAYDLVVQAMSGMMSINGYPDSLPLRTGISLGDMSAGSGIPGTKGERNRRAEPVPG